MGPEKKNKWWSQTDSNRRHPACKAGALPTELWPRKVNSDKTVKEQTFLKNLLYVINRFYHQVFLATVLIQKLKIDLASEISIQCIITFE